MINSSQKQLTLFVKSRATTILKDPRFDAPRNPPGLLAVGTVAIAFSFVGLAVLGYVIAWVAEGVGGAMMIVGAIGLAVFVLGQPEKGGDPVSALFWAGPFGWAGYLFVRSSASEKTGSSEPPSPTTT